MADELTAQQGEDTSTATTPEQGQTAPPTQAELYELRHNGRTHQLDRAKMVALAQQGFDYTQKSQGLSEREKTYQARISQYENALSEVKQFLTDKAKVTAYLSQLSAGTAEPNDVLTAEQTQGMLQRMSQQQREEFAQALRQMREEVQVNTMSADYSRTLNAHVGGLLQNYPELRSIPGVDRKLKAEVAEHRPRSVEEAAELLTQVAASWSHGIRGHFEEQKKAEAARSQGLSRGIEPPGGGGAPPPLGELTKPVKSFLDSNWRNQILHDFETMRR